MNLRFKTPPVPLGEGAHLSSVLIRAFDNVAGKLLYYKHLND